jgi:hypothetical protein
MKSPITTFTALILIIAAMFIIVFQFNDSTYDKILSPGDLSGNVPRCKTLTWKIYIPDKAAIIQCMALEPHYVKLLLPNGKIWLLNRHKKQVTLIDPANKTAKIMNIQKLPNIYDCTRHYINIPDCTIEQIGQCRIGRKQAIGFHLIQKQSNDEIIVWIDPYSQLPMQIEFLEANEPGQMESKIIWSDIVFDVELDESLFIFDLEGYKVEKLDSTWDWQDYCSIASLE